MGEEWVAQCKEGTCEGDCSSSGREVGWLGSHASRKRGNGRASCFIQVGMHVVGL